MLDITVAKLENESFDVDELEKLSGGVGVQLIDYSNNTPASAFQNDFPVVEWLLNTPVTQRAKSAMRNGKLKFFQGEDGLYHMLTPVKWGTTAPEDTTGECCWVPLNLAKCMGEVPIHLLCLKDCAPILEMFVNKINRFNSNDMINYFQRDGETYEDARKRMNLMSMAWFTGNTVINGTSTTESPVLKPFHGLLEVMEGADVIKIGCTDILGAFDSFACRMAVLGDTDYVFVAHPLVIEGIKYVVQPGQYGEYPSGWSKDASGNVLFHGHRFIAQKNINYDPATGLGDVYCLERNSIGLFLATGLAPSNDFIFSDMEETSRAEGCHKGCTYYYNFGTVFATDTNKLAVITDVPGAPNCVGEALNGLDYVVTPETIVPINV